MIQKLRCRALYFLLSVSAALLSSGQALAQLDKAVVDNWMVSLSNWQRWGANDELGSLNLITPQTRVAAAKLVKTGISVSMAHEVLTERAPDNGNPYEHEMTAVGSSPGPWSGDSIGVSYHGYAHSHLDALCHRFHNGKMYNGYSENEVTQEGCARLAITGFENGIFGRGILIDMAAFKGVDWLELGAPITDEDLVAWEQETGIEIKSGDVVLVRTGRWARRNSLGPWNLAAESAGLHASAAQWFKDKDISLIGSDVALDVFPSGVSGYTHPVHLLFLVAMGTPIFDNLDLEALAEEAARQNSWEFLFTTAPLRIPGGTGSPLNPIATF
ncbi:MAG: cyclase family protein [Pseudohongiellaceae bacterium]